MERCACRVRALAEPDPRCWQLGRRPPREPDCRHRAPSQVRCTARLPPPSRPGPGPVRLRAEGFLRPSGQTCPHQEAQRRFESLRIARAVGRCPELPLQPPLRTQARWPCRRPTLRSPLSGGPLRGAQSVREDRWRHEVQRQRTAYDSLRRHPRTRRRPRQAPLGGSLRVSVSASGVRDPHRIRSGLPRRASRGGRLKEFLERDPHLVGGQTLARKTQTSQAQVTEIAPRSRASAAPSESLTVQ